MGSAILYVTVISTFDIHLSRSHIILYSQVYSGYRFVHRASAHGMDVAILNIGATRGDKHASIKVSGKIGDILERLVV